MTQGLLDRATGSAWWRVGSGRRRPPRLYREPHVGLAGTIAAVPAILDGLAQRGLRAQRDHLMDGAG